MSHCMGTQAVGGLTEEDIERIRKLKGYIQADSPALTVSNKDAVMWAVNNELEKYE